MEKFSKKNLERISEEIIAANLQMNIQDTPGKTETPKAILGRNSEKKIEYEFPKKKSS